MGGLQSHGQLLRQPAVREGSRRDTYLKIIVKIKLLQTLTLNIFPAKIKHSLDKKFLKIEFFKNVLRKFGLRAVQRGLNLVLVDLKKC